MSKTISPLFTDDHKTGEFFRLVNNDPLYDLNMCEGNALVFLEDMLELKPGKDGTYEMPMEGGIERIGKAFSTLLNLTPNNKSAYDYYIDRLIILIRIYAYGKCNGATHIIAA